MNKSDLFTGWRGVSHDSALNGMSDIIPGTVEGFDSLPCGEFSI